MKKTTLTLGLALMMSSPLAILSAQANHQVSRPNANSVFTVGSVESYFGVTYEGSYGSAQYRFERKQLREFAKAFSNLAMPLQDIVMNKFQNIELHDDRGVFCQDSDVKFYDSQRTIRLEYDFSDNDMNDAQKILKELKEEILKDDDMKNDLRSTFAYYSRVYGYNKKSTDELKFELLMQWGGRRGVHDGPGTPHIGKPRTGGKKPVRLGRHNGWYDQMTNVASNMIEWVADVDSYISLDERKQYTQPITNAAADLYAVASGHGDSSAQTLRKAQELVDTIEDADDFLKELLERDYAYYAVQEILTLKEELKDMIN